MSTEVTNAFRQAQSVLARLQGMPVSSAGNFVGPDGAPYTATFRPADAFESQAAAREMTLHGFDDKSVVVATLTRDQFSAVPLDWRRKTATRLIPAPAQTCTIASLSIDDPVHFVLVLLFRQGS